MVRAVHIVVGVVGVSSSYCGMGSSYCGRCEQFILW